jgi:hypothetical protein
MGKQHLALLCAPQAPNYLQKHIGEYMKTRILLAVATMTFAAGPALADEAVTETAQPVVLSEAQMDNVTAAGYGKTLIDVTGKSFGQFIGPAKKNGTSVHSNYAGGVKALVEAALAGAHPIPGS